MKKSINIQRLGSKLFIQTCITDKKGVETCNHQTKEVGFFAKVFVKKYGIVDFIGSGHYRSYVLPKRKSKLKLIIKEKI